MVSRAQKQRMRDFTAGLIEESGYQVLQADESQILLTQDPEKIENPKKMRLLLHSRKIPASDLRRTLIHCRENDLLLSNIFYKDGSNFMVRMAGRGFRKGQEKSLKCYSQEDINKMVHLRALEKEVLELQEDLVEPEDIVSKTLVYFQPETARLEESLRGHHMKPVILDYEHVEMDGGHRSHGFARGRRKSIDYRIAEEIFSVNDRIMFKPSERGIYVVNPRED